jgi:polar amino acid transport system substrate-binding protein
MCCRFILLVAITLSIASGCKDEKVNTPDYAAQMKSFSFLTENYPPFNYEFEGEIYGVSTDILQGLFVEMNINSVDISLEINEWEIVYQQTLNQPNTMLFSVVRIPERENLFKWVGPIAPQKDVIIALGSQQISISNAADLATHTIGVIAGYSNIDQLIDLGVPQAKLIVVNGLDDLYTGLVNGSYDCIAYSEISHGLVVTSMGYNQADFEFVYTIQVSQLYFAFHLSTSDELISFIQHTLDDFKMNKTEDGSSVYEKILNKYQIIAHVEDNITEQMVIDLVNTTSSNFFEDASSTLIKINAGEAPYLDPGNPSLYAFVYDTDVTMVAHATNPLLVGVNFKGKTDAAGKPFRDEIISGALSHGTGWEDYVYTKPDQSGLYYKTTYYRLVTGNDGKQYVVCAGRYK